MEVNEIISEVQKFLEENGLDQELQSVDITSALVGYPI